MATSSTTVKAWFAERLRAFHAGRYQNFLNDTDPNNELLPKHHELSPAAVKVERNTGWPTLPSSVRAAADFYLKRVEAEDWGSVGVYRVPTALMETYAVRVTTDGDDGWLEVFDLDGRFLGAGRTYIELIAWTTQKKVREQFGDNWPKALDRKKTLWQVPAGPPPEPRFKPGQEVECRWQLSFVWFPARVVQADLSRVEVEFDDGSREWLEEDHVREVYGERQEPTVLPGMDALAPGDQAEFQGGGDTIFYLGTVVERRGNRIRMRKLDDSEAWTMPALCRPLTPDEVEPVPPLAVGDFVEFRWLGSSEIYKGWVIEREGVRLLIVSEYGIEESSTVGKCRRLVDPDASAGDLPAVAVGDRVDCRYQGGETYSPGKVSRRRGTRILVDYDDGSREWTTPRMCRPITGT